MKFVIEFVATCIVGGFLYWLVMTQTDLGHEIALLTAGLTGLISGIASAKELKG